MSPPPRAPGAAMAAIHSHLLELLPTAMQETMVAVMLTSPAGMLRSAVRGDSYPKPLIKVAEYVEMTPLETADCERKKCVNQSYLHGTQLNRNAPTLRREPKDISAHPKRVP